MYSSTKGAESADELIPLNFLQSLRGQISTAQYINPSKFIGLGKTVKKKLRESETAYYSKEKRRTV
jgi:hypothetical protein